MKIITLLFAAVSLFCCSCNNTGDENNASDSVIVLKDNSFTSLLRDLNGTRDLRTLLCQAWEMDDDLEVIKNNGEAMGNYPFRCFYLSEDSTFIKNPRNYMEYGRWSFDENNKILTLKATSGQKDEYRLAALGAKELIVVNTGIGSATKLKYVSSAKKYIHPLDNPYHIENNRWRIRPRFSEDDAAIKKRLKDCLHFYILFYRDNLARQENMISFYGLPTCLRWYRGGIFLVKKDDLAENWFNCFYSKEEGMKAWKIMDTLMSEKYTWNKDKITWVKKNLLVLQQMYDKL